MTGHSVAGGIWGVRRRKCGFVAWEVNEHVKEA
jgi:hypothetical protein